MTTPNANPNDTSAAAVAERYFTDWMAGDFAGVRTVLSDDVSFVGALGTADGAEDCLAGLQGMSKMVTKVDVLHRWVDGDDVITWYDLHSANADPIPTVNWMHVTAGRIDRIRVTFDPRPLLG